MNTELLESRWRPEQLQPVSCDYCGKNDTRELFVRPDGMRVVECCGCGLAFLSPRPKDEFIPRLYEGDYFQKDAGSAATGYQSYLTKETRLEMLHAAESRLALLLPRWDPQGKDCLEIGCATGEFCVALQKRGAKVTGSDLSRFAIEEARRRYPGIPFEAGTLDDWAGREAYDALFAFEVIEHVLSPTRFFKAANRLLRPDGLLALSTPNLDCGRAVGFNSWVGCHVSMEHLFYFSKDALEKIAARAGFETVEWFTGLGDGLLRPPPPPTLKSRLKRTLASLGLLGLAKSLKRRASGPVQLYRPHGTGHNLLMAFRKQTSGG